MGSDWRQPVADLTNDTDNDDVYPLAAFPSTIAPTKFATSLPRGTRKLSTTSSLAQPKTSNQQLPQSTPRSHLFPSVVSPIDKPGPNKVSLAPKLNAKSPSHTTNSGSWECSGQVSTYHLPIDSNSHHGMGKEHDQERAAKRIKIRSPREQVPPALLRSFQREGGNATQNQEADVLRWRYFSGTISSPQDDDEDSILSDVSSTSEAKQQQPTNTIPIDAQVASTLVPLPTLKAATKPSTSALSLKKSTNHFTDAQDHYLIFLKEIRQFPWKQITAEFNVEFPSRPYSALQSRYATYLNKRDRSQDPAVLILPSRLATESTIDWQNVHASNPGPKAQSPSDSIPTRQTIEKSYDSEGGLASRRDRSSRAKRVDYTWPKSRQRVNRTGMEESDEHNVVMEDFVDVNVSTRSDTSVEETPLPPDAAFAVDNEPLIVDHVTHDAKIALSTRKGLPNQAQSFPYLSNSQRSTARAPDDWEWDQLSSREWQGSLVHVDFSPTEIRIVEKTLRKLQRPPQISRHSTRRRQLRELVKHITDPVMLRSIAEIRQNLPSRDKASVAAFLQDAKAGLIADVPQIKRLAAARPQSSQKTSMLHMIRQREIGCQARRGWRVSSKPVTYEINNKFMDTIGPSVCWTGASSDVHVVAWAPDGESFAAGAVAVDDPDSMQYNRPNNLLYGDLSRKTIHELGEHTKDRTRTESGANSTHAMFVSQDPKLYTTVSSVAFSSSGRLMYSAGYDGTICVWHTETESHQPMLGSKLNARAKIDIMTVNRRHEGVLATAAKITESKAVRLLTVNEEDPTQFTKHSFHSLKAISRSDLRILPTALQFEPTHGCLLLAGFGANVRDQGYDITGDLCLWDVETLTPFQVHGSNKNIFDVAFNSNRSHMPLFAIGCVAGGSVNRGTRSLLRLYDENGLDKYRCPLEIECRALDMNEISWNPYDEYLIAAGCTDGRSYVWDIRWPNDPVRTLSHGRSLMALQDDVPHEVTDTGVRFLSWGTNASRLYSGSSDGVVKVWDVTRSEEDTFIKDIVSLDSGIMSGVFSPDMSKLVVGEVNGSVNVLEVGRDDCLIKDTEKFRYAPYIDDDESTDSIDGDSPTISKADSGIAEGNIWLQTKQLQVVPLGGLPIRQVVQGPEYAGPFDQSIDAPFLRQQALEFQLAMATKPGPQCSIINCKDTVKVTSEDAGDSGRSEDRIPDELRQQWKAIDQDTRLHPGKTKCTYCGRLARPSTSDNADDSVLCERCSFACFRCGAINPIAGATTTLICDSCAGVWDMGSLGYECIQQPILSSLPKGIPTLKKFGKEAYLETLEDVDTSFGDEVNALTDYYFSLAIDRPASPPL